MTRRKRHESQLTRMKPGVERVLTDLGLDVLTTAMRVAERWPEVVGEQVAKHSRPVGIRGGVLEVEVVSSVWCQELQLRRPQIVAALATALGDEAPREVRFRVGYSGRP